MKTRITKLAAAVALSCTSIISANAGVLDISTTQDAAYAEFDQNASTGRVFVHLTSEGAGIAQVNHIRVYANTPEAGYQYWSGFIPANASTINGVASANISFNTCDVEPTGFSTGHCGLVDVTITNSPLAFGSTGGGAYAYNYGDIIYQYSGSWSRHVSNATGTVYGVAIDTENVPYARAAIGRYTNVSVTVSTGN